MKVLKSKPAAIADGLLTIKDAAEFLDVHPATIRKWIAAGTMPAHRIGSAQRAIRVRTSDVLKAANISA
jgi:excisionase family DNA binding protein